MEGRVIRKLNFNKKKLATLVICLLVGLIIVIKLIHYGKDAMKPPVVFLIPENFIGPVFVVFDQEDGQNLKNDPLGMSLTVPENGLIKVKASKNEVLTRGMNYDKRNVYWIIVTKDGQRINMPYHSNVRTDYEKGLNWFWYIDQNNQAKQIVLDEKLYPKTNDKDFYYFNQEQLKLKTAFSWDSCDAYIWKNLEELNKYRSDWNIDKKRSNANFNCMSFSIINFKMNDKELNLENFLGDYSLPEFEEKLNEVRPFRVKYLKEYLELNKNSKD